MGGAASGEQPRLRCQRQRAGRASLGGRQPGAVRWHPFAPTNSPRSFSRGAISGEALLPTVNPYISEFKNSHRFSRGAASNETPRTAQRSTVSDVVEHFGILWVVTLCVLQLAELPLHGCGPGGKRGWRSKPTIYRAQGLGNED